MKTTNFVIWCEAGIVYAGTVSTRTGEAREAERLALGAYRDSSAMKVKGRLVIELQQKVS